jgi:hypothetical protein
MGLVRPENAATFGDEGALAVATHDHAVFDQEAKRPLHGSQAQR